MKTMMIEQLLMWAFNEELPKIDAGIGGPSAAPSTWNAVQEMISLGTIVDRQPNRHGVISGFVSDGEAHPDAYIVSACVARLAETEGFNVPPAWAPFPEWSDEHGLIAAAVARIRLEEMGRAGRLNGRHVVNLVRRCAILKSGPDWQVSDPPKIVKEGDKGKGAWFVTRTKKDRLGNTVTYLDNGFDKRTRRPKKGAFQKFRLATSIRGAVIARMEWQLWQSALEMLHGLMKGRLSSIDLLPFRPYYQPWVTQMNIAGDA